MKCQASLELLMSLAALLSFVALSMSLVTLAERDAKFAIDVHSARLFASATFSETESLYAFGEGSQSEVSSKILGEWRIRKSSGKFFLDVLGHGKEYSVALPESLRFGPQKNFFGRISIVLKKSGSAVIAMEPKP